MNSEHKEPEKNVTKHFVDTLILPTCCLNNNNNDLFYIVFTIDTRPGILKESALTSVGFEIRTQIIIILRVVILSNFDTWPVILREGVLGKSIKSTPLFDWYFLLILKAGRQNLPWQVNDFYFIGCQEEIN